MATDWISISMHSMMTHVRCHGNGSSFFNLVRLSSCPGQVQLTSSWPGALESCQELTIPAYGSLSKSISVLCAFILAFSFINSKAMTTPVVVPNPSESVAAAFWRTSWLRKFDWLVLKQQDGGSERPFCKTCQKFLFQKNRGWRKFDFIAETRKDRIAPRQRAYENVVRSGTPNPRLFGLP